MKSGQLRPHPQTRTDERLDGKIPAPNVAPVVPREDVRENHSRTNGGGGPRHGGHHEVVIRLPRPPLLHWRTDDRAVSCPGVAGPQEHMEVPQHKTPPPCQSHRRGHQMRLSLPPGGNPDPLPTGPSPRTHHRQLQLPLIDLHCLRRRGRKPSRLPGRLPSRLPALSNPVHHIRREPQHCTAPAREHHHLS